MASEAGGVTEDLGANDEILNLLRERLAIGLERYGHGVRPDDDTRTWGTERDSWVEMGLEEILDLAIYLGAAILRVRRIEDEMREKEQAINDRWDKVLAAEKALEERGAGIEDGGESWWRRWVGRRS